MHIKRIILTVHLYFLAWLALLTYATLTYAAPTHIDSVRVWRAPDSTRLVFDLNAPSEHKIFSLSQPDRLVIDVENTRFKANTDDINFDNTPVLKMRYGARDKNDIRVVLDLNSPVNPRSFFLAAHGDKPDRLVIDLFDKKPQQIIKPIKKVIPKPSSKRDILIAIDAGHGGEDPGAIGPKKQLEKEIVLKIATQLKWLFEKQSGYRVKMIRTGDYYIGLRDRRNAARKVRADLFVSIHADAFTSPRASGASVYALSRRGATSETARFLASRENDADLIGGVGDVKLDDKDKMLAGVLVDLSMNATLANSLDVGAKVLSQLKRITKLHSKRVEQAGFAVLKSPDVPSILVETGYISNPKEARKLSTPAYRKKIATAIFNGITAYFNNTPPEGTLLAHKKYGERKPVALNNSQYHVVVRGDTLSAIAVRHGVSVNAILKANSLKKPGIRVGQKILIPQPKS